MRLSGLSSGFDFEGFIQQIMAVERRPLQKLEERKVDLVSEKAAWGTLESRIASLRDLSEHLALAANWDKLSVTMDRENVVTANALPGAAVGDYEITVLKKATSHTVASSAFPDKVGLTGTFTLSAGTGCPSIEVTVNAEDTLQDLADRINSQFTNLLAASTEKPAYVRAQVIADKLVLSRSETGALEIVMDDLGSGLLYGLGLVDQNGVANTVISGADAELTINGVSVTSPDNTSTDAIAGVELTVLSEDPTLPVHVSVQPDDETIINKVKEFVNGYNELVSTVSKEAALKKDWTSRNLAFAIQDVLFQPVAGVGPGDLGLSVDNNGKLSVDEAKLTDQLGSNRGLVENWCADTFDRVRAQLDACVETDGIIAAKRDGLDERIKWMADSIERAERRLELREEYLFKKYEALEMVLSQLQSQQAWLSQQLTQL